MVRLYRNSGELNDAVTVFSDGIKNHPKSTSLLLDRGDTLAGKREFAKAIKDYKKAASLNQESAIPLFKIGMAFEAIGEQAKAKAVSQNAIKVDPKLAPAYNNLAWLSVQTSTDLDLALEWAKQAASISNRNPLFLDTLAWTYRALGDLSNAQKVLQEAVGKKPSPELYYHLGIVQRELDNKESAIQSFTEALKLNSGFSEAESAKQYLSELTEGT